MIQTSTPSITFKVDDVTPAAALLPECKTHVALRGMLHSDIESCCDYHGSVVHGTHYHGLLAAVHTAFSQHRPLILSPDMIWITIQQGLAQHMALHAERLRGNFVRHEGRLDLTVNISHFAKGSSENPWEEAFATWAGQIRNHIGPELHDHLVASFSTTGTVERAVSQVVMMDIFERYFRYKAMCICGIPQITLEGTVEDWQQLRQRLDFLAPFDMKWWIKELRPICDEFVNAAKGKICLKHWQSICKLQEEYGGDIINGWIAKLFPYLRQSGQGPARIRNSGWSFSTLDAPTGLSRVPFRWDILKPGEPERHYAMEIVGGFVGVQQMAESKALRPRLGWAVRERPTECAVLDRLERTCKVFPRLEAEGESNPRKYTLYDRIPDDAADFFNVTNGAHISDSSGALRFEFLPLEKWQKVFGPQPPDDGGDEFRGSNGCTAGWARFCNLADGTFVAIDLESHLVERLTADEQKEISQFHGEWDAAYNAENKRIEEEQKRWWDAHSENRDGYRAFYFELRDASKILSEYKVAYAALPNKVRHINLVILCRPESVGRPGQCPIIAESFSEFLKKAQDSAGAYWWLQSGYASYGDAIGRSKP